MNEYPRPQTSGSEVPARQQIGLIPIFHIMAVFAAGLPFGVWTIVLTTLILGGWWILFKVKNGKSLIALILYFVALYGLSMPVQQIRSTPYWAAYSLHWLRQFNLSIINDESGPGAFPPWIYS